MKAEATISRLLIYTAIVANMILGAVIFLRLQTTPADVISEVRLASEILDKKTQATEKRIEGLASTIESRGEWIKSVDAMLTENARDRLFRHEFREWCEEVKVRNADKMLDLPDIGETPPQ